MAVGVMFVWTGVAKVVVPGPTIGLVRDGFAVSVEQGRGLVLALAGAEWGLGLWLISGVRQVGSLTAGVGMLGVFTAGLALAHHRGFTGDCGCGLGSMSVPQALLRNGLLLALLAVLLVAAPRWTGNTRQGDSS